MAGKILMLKNRSKDQDDTHTVLCKNCPTASLSRRLQRQRDDSKARLKSRV
jgi:hypothetical protein